MVETAAAPAAPVTNATPAVIAPQVNATVDVTKGNASTALKTGEAAIKRMLKGKVDGKEVEIPEDEAVAAWQKRTSADKRFQEAATTKKQAEGILKAVSQSKDNPQMLKKIFSDVGVDFRATAEQFLYSLIQEEQMTPEQKELHETKKKLSEYEQEKQEKQKAEEEQQRVELEGKYEKEYQASIIETLDKTDLPKSEFTIGRIARYLYLGLERGVELQPTDVMDLVRRDYNNEMTALFKNASPDQIAAIAGEDFLKKLREFDLNKVRNGIGGEKPNQPNSPLRKPTPKKGLTKEEFQELVKQRVQS